jgi:hypothetical protein
LAIEFGQKISGESYSVSHLKKVKTEIELLESKHQTYLDGLGEDLNLKTPTFLILNGKKVLSKRISFREGDDDEQFIRKAFPSVSVDNLAYQIDYLSDKECIVSVIRKDVLNNTLQSFQKEGFEIVDYSLGAFSILPLFDKNEQANVQLGYSLFDLENNSIQYTDELPNELTLVLGQEVDTKNALSFAYGLKILANGSYQAVSNEVVLPRKNWQFQRLYKKGLLAGVGSIFVLLLISFAVYTYYFDKNGSLIESTASFDSQLKLVNELRQNYDSKAEFIEVNGSGGLSFSRMADEIASVLPKQLSLDELNFYPLEKRLKKEKLVRFHRGEIRVKGETRNYGYFQEWFDALEKMEWVEDIDVSGYQEKTNTHRADFSIKILIKG